jgi:peptidoglycan/LPS O-acetylase OafA/YrhL
MTRPFSLYLDLVRVLAALAVVAFHGSFDRFGGDWLKPAVGHMGTDPVMVFFVLSGFVIAFVADTKERTPREYWICRLSRLWSVAVPAVVLSFALDTIGRSINPAVYIPTPYAIDMPIVRALVALTFTNEIWESSIAVFSNGPYWSLSYEFWFYALFALWIFTTGNTRVIAIAVVALFVGPGVLLLLPVWLAGCWTYGRLKTRPRAPIWLGAALFVLPIALIAAAEAYWLMVAIRAWVMVPLIGHWYFDLHRSGQFLYCYFLAAMIVANFVGFAILEPYLGRALLACERPIRWAAARTFSIYLFHYPIMMLGAAILHPGTDATSANLLIIGLGLSGAFALAPLTEQKKDLWRHALAQLLLRRRTT